MKIVILDDMEKESSIYFTCTHFYEWKQPREKDIIATHDILTFIQEAETADFLFADPGELGSIVSDKVYEAHRLLFDFMVDRPSKLLTFVMHLPVQYYQGITIFELMNVETIDSGLINWWVAKKISEYLFKNAPLDLFTKDWTNLQEIEEYLPKLGIKIARQVYSQLHDGRIVPNNFSRRHLINRIRNYYKERWHAEMKRRGVRNF
jgi:hypothetical protein